MKGEIFGLVLFVLFASPFSCSFYLELLDVEMGSTEESPEGRLSSNGLGDGSASLTEDKNRPSDYLYILWGYL
jgi:hypothetical protein